MTTNPTRYRPTSPEGISQKGDTKAWLKSLYDDIYPKIQSYTPTVANVSNSSVSAGYLRQGRCWFVSVVLRPILPANPMICSGGSFQLPFNSFAPWTFFVRVNGELLPAAVDKNTVMLPNFNSTAEVVITGQAAE